VNTRWMAGAALLGAAGCGPPGAPADSGRGGDDSAETTDTAALVWSGDADGGSEDVGFTVQRAGSAEVVQGVDWLGAETMDVLESDTGELLCSFAWPTQSSQPSVSCAECQFAFIVEYGAATLLSGTCDDVAASPIVYLGYAAVAWSEAEGDYVAGALFTVVDGDDWVMASHNGDGVVRNSWDGTTFTYTLPELRY
jgi:hypothetical protein